MKKYKKIARKYASSLVGKEFSYDKPMEKSLKKLIATIFETGIELGIQINKDGSGINALKERIKTLEYLNNTKEKDRKP